MIKIVKDPEDEHTKTPSHFIRNIIEEDIKSGKFNGKISAEFTPPKTWVLEKLLSFKTGELSSSDIEVLLEIGANVDNNGRIICNRGMKTDLASVPRIAWAVIAPWDVARAAVIHDHLYAVLRKYYNSFSMDKEVWKRASTHLETIL